MSIRTRIFMALLLVMGVGFFYLVDWISKDLTPQYRESTEEPLVDASRVLASLAAASVKGGVFDTGLFKKAFDDVYSRPFEARIYDFVKREVDFRVYITDKNGIVIFDSDDGRAVGEDYSRWRDVSHTLAGEYGARTSRDLPNHLDQSVLYVAAPVMVDGEISGVLTVGKPARNANKLIEAAKRKLFTGGAVTFLIFVLIGLMVSAMLTRPVKRLTDYALAVKEGARVPLPPLGKSEIGELGSAFEEMRDALEGKQYVENYIQTLTHEIKSPLSAIKGAAELLNEKMPEEERVKFISNIRNETGRIEGIVEKMLLLSSLEAKKGLPEKESVDLAGVIKEALESVEAAARSRGIKFSSDLSDDAVIRGERFLILHGVMNLLQNAVEFSPDGGTIVVSCLADSESVVVTIRDEGSGIPDYARERVFERFYSLKRPATGKKSSGLGLSLVSEVAKLHGGSVDLSSAAGKGTTATLRFEQ